MNKGSAAFTNKMIKVFSKASIGEVESRKSTDLLIDDNQLDIIQCICESNSISSLSQSSQSRQSQYKEDKSISNEDGILKKNTPETNIDSAVKSTSDVNLF